MCGVIGLVYEHDRDDLGQIAGELLETLQYRGYDSTGAVIQNAEAVTLKKGVGAPSDLVHSLGIVDLAGRVFCGQVRWATFGAVDEANSQPHVVHWHREIQGVLETTSKKDIFVYGAHNGNVTNCDALKVWLQSEGHDVKSDNDGEMVVHVIAHWFADFLGQGLDRSLAMRRAAGKASKQLEGSFAAVVVDPITHTLCAIKRGSSLYLGTGHDEQGPFVIASSDLSSVLKRTRVLVNMSEGEFAQYTAGSYAVYALDEPDTPLHRLPIRSRLRVEDTALQEPFKHFMAQEIWSQPQTARDALRMFEGGSPAARATAEVANTCPAPARQALEAQLEELRAQYSDDALAKALTALRELELASPLAEIGRAHPELGSEDHAFFADLVRLEPDQRDLVHGLDAYLEMQEVAELAQGVASTVDALKRARSEGRRVYLVCCGTSYHAAKAASLFFASAAGTEVIPLLPGEFRGQYERTFREGDLFVAVSQSGETKDLIDIINTVQSSGKEVTVVALVNNLNSTLAQEKADIVVPLRCGPEVAVPATKSFINQLTVFYGLARRLGEALGRPRLPLPELPALIRQTLEETADSIEAAAELTFLAPSMHLLATRMLAVAKEGALKIREVVLNHTEGFEGSEFKHGPNTILGFNTLAGPAQIQALLNRLANQLPTDDPAGFVRSALSHSMDALYADYPLVFVTGPDRRDIDLTISQINTHKIRGATTIVIAEEDPRLREAAEKQPAGHDAYRSVYIPLPKTDDTLLATFTASVALHACTANEREKDGVP